MQRLNALVRTLLSQHEGGEVFFDHLDEALRSDDLIVDALIASLHRSGGFVVSGEFGRFFSNYYPSTSNPSRPIITVNGGLRQGVPLDDLGFLQLEGTKWVFVDDSFYSGSTRDAIRRGLGEYGAEIVSTHVIYDGSRIRDPDVNSLYRYFDHHDP